MDLRDCLPIAHGDPPLAMDSPGRTHIDVEEVRALLLDVLPDSEKSRPIEVQRWDHVGRYSRIFRASVPGIGHELAIKYFVDPDTGKRLHAAARESFAALTRVHNAMRIDAAFRVPTPWFLIEPEGATVIEWIDGPSVTERLLPWRSSLRDARALMERSGRWLRRFADARPLPPRPLAVEGKLAGVDAMQRDELGNEPVAIRACRELREHAALASRDPLRQSWLHGDFKTDNLLCDGDAIVGIDFYAKYENAVAHDAAAFVNDWRLTLCDPRAWRWRPWASALSTAFLASADESLLGRNRLPYAWIALHVMLGNWCEFKQRRRRTAAHAYLQACFAQIVKRMTRELEDAALRPVA